MQRRSVFMGLVLAVLVGVFFYLRVEQRTQIDFEQVEPIPGYKMEMREPPLRRRRLGADVSRGGQGLLQRELALGVLPLRVGGHPGHARERLPQ